MVVFLAHWCPHCNAEIPVINELRDAGRVPAGVNVVAVSTAVSPGQPNFPPSKWLDDKDWTYPAMADGVDMVNETFIASNAFGVTGFPFITLIDANGSGGRPLVGRAPGERDRQPLGSAPQGRLTHQRSIRHGQPTFGRPPGGSVFGLVVELPAELLGPGRSPRAAVVRAPWDDRHRIVVLRP